MMISMFEGEVRLSLIGIGAASEIDGVPLDAVPFALDGPKNEMSINCEETYIGSVILKDLNSLKGRLDFSCSILSLRGSSISMNFFSTNRRVYRVSDV